MSDAGSTIGQEERPRRLATQWQIPLLLASCGLFGWGLWNLRPQPPHVPFSQRLDQILALRRAGLQSEASKLVEELLASPERASAEQLQLHQVLAEIIYDVESKAQAKNPVNLERLVRHYRLSVNDPADLSADVLRRMGEAWDWLNRPVEAIKSYKQAVAKGLADATPVRRRIIDLQISSAGLSGDDLAKELEAFAASAPPGRMNPDDLLWAVHRRVELYIERGRYSDAEAYLESLRPTVEKTANEPERNRYEFLQTWVLYKQGRSDEAERILRVLRNRMTVRDDTDAASGWLLGRIAEAHSAPETALGFFDAVCQTHFDGPYVAASKLGRAECLAQLERHDEAIAAYGEVVAMLSSLRHSPIIDSNAVIASATGWYESTRAAGRLTEALGYLQVAVGLIPAADHTRQAVYIERRADLVSALAEQDLHDADRPILPEVQANAAQLAGEHAKSRDNARRRLREAGECYLHLADLLTEDEPQAAAAVWKAADRFDQAGERTHSINVLEAFIQGRPTSPRIPAALRRLGQSYQAIERYPEAIRQYQRNVSEFPRTPAGIASIVPLAECYMALGPQHTGDAEQTLLSLLDEPPDRPPLVTPAAAEFRDALFKLADLYAGTGQFDRAIVRLEEAISRYPEDPRIPRARYQLAEAYRRSAGQVPAAMAEAKNLTPKDQLMAELHRRLQRARQLYDAVIAAGDPDAAASRPATADAAPDNAYVRMSYLYRADCVFDEMEYGGNASPEGYAEAVRLYDLAAWRFRGEPSALSAYTQIIHCYLRMGDVARARTTLERARWILRGIPDDPNVWRVPGENKRTWNDYLAWLGNSPTFRER
jgi:tetratricopeptide (TPR) repeat protein